MTIRYEGRRIRKPEVVTLSRETIFLLPSRESPNNDLVIRSISQEGRNAIGVVQEGKEINSDTVLNAAGINWTDTHQDPLLIFVRRKRKA